MSKIMSMGITSATALVLLLAAGFAEHAAADSRTVQGHQLILTDNLSSKTVIATDSSLVGEIRLSLDGDISCLTVTGGANAVVDASGCSDEAGSLRIDVSPDMPVTIAKGGDGDMNIGDLRAPLTLTIDSSGDVKIGKVQALNLVSRGSGDAGIGMVSGAATIDMSGKGDVRIGILNGSASIRKQSSGDLAIGAISADSVSVTGDGSGDVLIGAGSIGALVARLTGSGDMAIAATTRDADVTASGGADVKLGRVTGMLKRQAGDSSNIVVVGSDLVNSLVGKVAASVGSDDSSGKGGRVVVHTGPGAGHFITIAVVAILLFFSWRAVRRAGGFGGVARRAQTISPSGAPSHPGVVAFADAMARLDQRLGRVENYVTSREFELQQKFRDLNKT